MTRYLKYLPLLAALLLFSQGAKAQSLPCSALSASLNSCFTDTLTANERWYSFVAASPAYHISVSTNEGYSPWASHKIHSLKVLSGNCSSVSAVAEATAGGPSLSVVASGLTAGHTYYIQLSNPTTPCTACSYTGNDPFKLCINAVPVSSTGCDVIENGSFEQMYNCVAGVGAVGNAFDWSVFMAGTPDLYTNNTCYIFPPPPSLALDVPLNMGGYQYANTGNNYTGFLTYWQSYHRALGDYDSLDYTAFNHREYMQQQFTQPMMIGEKYRVSMYYNLANNSNVATQGPGIHLSMNSPAWNYNGWLVSLTPTFEAPTLTDTLNWVLYSDTLTADSAYQFLTIGSFRSDAQSTLQQVSNVPYLHLFQDSVWMSYYLVDDVSIQPDHKLTLPADQFYCTGQSTSTTIAANFTNYGTNWAHQFSWTSVPNDPSMNQVSDLVINVAPTQTTSYALTVNDPYHNCSYTDTVTIFIVPEPTVTIQGPTSACDTMAKYYIQSCADCSYSWSVSSGGTITSGQNTTMIYVDWNQATTDQYVIAYVTNGTTGCTGVDTLFVNKCCLAPPPGTTYFDPASSIVFPTGATSGTVYINGTLTIDQNLSAITAHWYFGADAKVKILPGVSVLIQESVLEAGCGVMWDGIVIMDSTASLDVDASTIEDAEEAIRSDHGGQYFIHARTRLNKNHYGLVVTAYNNNHPGIIKETEITCLPSPYSTGNYLLPPLSNLRTDAGISITDVKNITIGSNVGPGDKNTFDNMNIGVHSVRSNTTVYNNEFKNIVTVNSNNVAKAAYWAEGKLLSFPPLSITNYTHTIGSNAANCKNYFTNCINGVRAETNLNVDVTNNRFSTIQSNAIVIQSCKLFNQISVKNDTILNAQAGVRLMNNNNVTAYVTNNFIEYNATPPAIAFGSYGTGVFMSQTNNMIAGAYTVSNNTLSKLKIGVQGISLNKPRVQENTITLVPGTGTFNLLRGVNLDRCYAPRITNNDISTTTATTSPQKGGIYVAASQNSLISCNDVSDIGFDIQCSGTPMTFSTIALNDLYNSRWGLMLSNWAVIGQQGTYSSPSCNTWSGTFTAGLLARNSAIGPIIYYKPSGSYIPPSNVTLNSAFPWQPTQSSATGSCKGCYYKQPFVISELESMVNGEYDLETAGQWMLDHAIYQMVRDDSTMLADSSSKLADFASVLDEANIGIYEQVLKTLDNPYASTQEIETARDESEGTEPQNVLEANFKTVIDIYSDMLLNESDPTAAQLDTLQVIAAKCPFTEGPAVYIARAIVAPYDTTFYINTCEMSPDSSGAKLAPQVEANEPAKAQVYPNPTNEELSVVVGLKEGEVGMFEIYDTRGSKVLSQQLKAGSENKVKVAALSPGVYFYKMVVNEVEVEANKLVIIR